MKKIITTINASADTVEKIIAKKKLLFSITFALFIIVYAIISGVLILHFNPFSIATSITPASIGGVLLISLLGSILITLQIYIYTDLKKQSSVSSKAGFGALIASVFVNACPSCTPLIFSIIGFSAATTILAKYGMQIILASAVLMLFSIYFAVENIENAKTCKIKN